jgi:hypothetical protein
MRGFIYHTYSILMIPVSCGPTDHHILKINIDINNG